VFREKLPMAARSTRSLLPYLLITPPIILVFGLIFFPAAQSFVRTLTGADGGFSFERYLEFMNDRSSVTSLIFTFQVTFLSLIGLFARFTIFREGAAPVEIRREADAPVDVSVGL
jgi:ABC-type sugar transport system permease subunit